MTSYVIFVQPLLPSIYDSPVSFTAVLVTQQPDDEAGEALESTTTRTTNGTNAWSGREMTSSGTTPQPTSRTTTTATALGHFFSRDGYISWTVFNVVISLVIAALIVLRLRHSLLCRKCRHVPEEREIPEPQAVRVETLGADSSSYESIELFTVPTGDRRLRRRSCEKEL